MTDLTGQKPVFELELTRVIDAPRARVYEAWTKPDQVVKWFAPKPFELVVHKMDFRVGGRFEMAMRGPGGQEFPFSGTYHEVAPPAKLVWGGAFTGGADDEMRTVVNFTEEGKKTKIHVRQSFYVMTPQIQHATKGAQQGWTMTLDQLAEFTAGK